MMNKIPKVTFRTMTFKENMDMMALFIKLELDQKEKPNIMYFKNKYQEIKDIDFSNMNIEQISNILQSKLFNDWQGEMKQAENQANNFQNNWDLINNQVMSDLSKRLNIAWPDNAIDIQARVGIMYSCPRYIDKRMFDTTINVDMDTMREIVIHECCHFLYFEKWKELFNDYDESHYNYPHIIWHLSEAIIDPLLNNSIFSKYTNKELLSYKVFYETIIDDISIIDKLREMVNQKSIDNAIKDCYNYFIKNEKIIKGY